MAVAMIVYFLPSIIGWNKRNADAIVALNVLLGWTFLGWVAALVWALVRDPDQIEDDDEPDELVTEWEIKEESPWEWLMSKFKRK